jgi:hypothetical protein
MSNLITKTVKSVRAPVGIAAGGLLGMAAGMLSGSQPARAMPDGDCHWNYDQWSCSDCRCERQGYLQCWEDGDWVTYATTTQQQADDSPACRNNDPVPDPGPDCGYCGDERCACGETAQTCMRDCFHEC